MPGPSKQKSVRVSHDDCEFLRANGIVFSKLVKRAIKHLREESALKELENVNEDQPPRSRPVVEIRTGEQPSSELMASGER